MVKPYSQYPGDYASNLPSNMGEVFSIFSQIGMTSDTIEQVLWTSKTIREIEYNNNPMLANSSATTLMYSMCRDGSVPSASNILENESARQEKESTEHEDWLTWWSVETLFKIAMMRNQSVTQVLDIIPLGVFMTFAPRYHSLPFSVFKSDVLEDDKYAAN